MANAAELEPVIDPAASIDSTANAETQRVAHRGGRDRAPIPLRVLVISPLHRDNESRQSLQSHCYHQSH